MNQQVHRIAVFTVISIVAVLAWSPVAMAQKVLDPVEFNPEAKRLAGELDNGSWATSKIVKTTEGELGRLYQLADTVEHYLPDHPHTQPWREHYDREVNQF